MVSSFAHLLNSTGHTDGITVICASLLSYMLYRMGGRWGFLPAVVSLSPLFFLPDYSIAKYIPINLGISPLNALLGSIAAIAFTELIRNRRKLHRQEHYLFDPSLTKSFKVIDKKEYDLNDIPALVSDMRNCYNSGYTRPIAKRLEQLNQLRKMIAENEDRIIQSVQKDMRKPTIEAMIYEVSLVQVEVEHAIHNLEKWTAPKPVGFNIFSMPSNQYLQPEPYGLALIIGTWNFPFQLELSPAIAAIAAGNAVIIKPCTTSGNAARTATELLRKYMDPKCVQVVGASFKGDRECTAKLLEEHFDVIFFTGSPAVGRVILEGAAKHLTPCVLELGGKNPVYVDKDVDIDLAAKRIVWGRMINCGQQCIAPDFVLCHHDSLEKFAKRCAHYCKELYTEQYQDNMAAIVGDKQMSRIIKLLETHGGKLIAGGKYNKATRFIEPTVIQCQENSSLMGEEIFGPILALVEVPNVKTAIRMINDRPKPLALYIFSTNEQVIQTVINNTSSGGVTVNATLYHVGHPGLPFGGVGNSGMGRYHGKYGFEAFSHEKPVLFKHKWFDFGLLSDPFFVYPPWNNVKKRLFRSLQFRSKIK